MTKQSILSRCHSIDCFAEFIIGWRFAPTRWLAMTKIYRIINATRPIALRSINNRIARA